MNYKFSKLLTKYLYIFVFILSTNLLIIPTFSSPSVKDLSSNNENESLKEKDSVKDLNSNTDNESLKEKDSINKVPQEDFYLLGVGDKLQLKIIGAPELNMIINILNDGTVSLPLIGVNKLEGLTISAATRYVEKLLSKELINPQVELNLLERRPTIVSIIGEISRPGIYNLGTNTNDLPTLINAIESAGGLSKKADLSNITLKRRISGKDFKYKQTNINLRKLILAGDFQQNPYLFDGDIINVNSSKNPDKDLLTIASTSLSPNSIAVNFVGEVIKPGTIKLKANTTLIDGIFAAGGPVDLRSNYNYVEILRMNKDGTGFRKRYKINLASDYSEKNNPILNDGDSVWLRKNKFAKATDAVGIVARPLRDLVSIWTLFTLVE